MARARYSGSSCAVGFSLACRERKVGIRGGRVSPIGVALPSRSSLNPLIPLLMLSNLLPPPPTSLEPLVLSPRVNKDHPARPRPRPCPPRPLKKSKDGCLC